MIAISLTVMVCAVTFVAAAAGPANVRSCEIYNEERPMADLGRCLFQPSRDELGREAVARAGRQLEPDADVETTCRMMTSGSGVPTG
jgi:hypothetical protein